ncbi:DUF2750 domain-containing protein [Algibacillus agarilyticus]|uniref:DUF2750 domain-containing protein n=1 Tax=Algibacillus agarilyticus TaxID=2234133 RepID=UPI000DD06C74|nr:DUF2750 domain-containing protein [Algibacillus agarilyticus]
MLKNFTAQRLAEIEKYNIDQRFKYALKEMVKHGAVWILTDEHGCMMLTIDDEDGIPVWPNEFFAQEWATGEWETCQPKAIAFDKWFRDWTSGMAEDELSVVVFPNKNEEGVVLFPDEFEYELKQQLRAKLN